MVKEQNIKRVLIVRQDRLGDTILTLPLASALKKAIPDVVVDFLVKGYTAPLVRRFDDIDNVILLDEYLDKSVEKLVNELTSHSYDLAIIPNANTLLAKALHKAGIPMRRSGGWRWYMWRFNYWMQQSRKHPVMNELDYNFQLLKGFAEVPKRNQVTFPFTPAVVDKVQVDLFLQQQGVQNFVILHPGSGGSALDLPLSIWSEVIRKNPFGKNIILTGSETEKALCDELINAGGGNAINAAGRFSITELLELIAQSSFFMANSTGPLHMARACNAALLGIYSTFKACHPVRWGPYGMEQSNTLLPPGEHYESFAKSKEISRSNMQKMSADMVFERIASLYNPQ